MKTRIGTAILGSLLAATALSVDARENDRTASASRHGHDYTPSHDYRNDHRGKDGREGRHGHGNGNGHGHNHDHHPGSHDHRGHTHVVYADVVAVIPIYEYAYEEQPVRECRPVGTVRYERHNGGAGMVLGGVIGGAIGHDIARGTGNDAAIVAGTLLGALVGHDLAASHTTVVTEPRVQCETHTHQRRERYVTGYRVEYRYNNYVYHTRTDHHPGARIRVTISLNN